LTRLLHNYARHPQPFESKPKLGYNKSALIEISNDEDKVRPSRKQKKDPKLDLGIAITGLSTVFAKAQTAKEEFKIDR
jgi:hypothetical protein